MDFITRAYKNVRRNISKSMLLFITFFIIANLAFCGFAVLSASDNISTEIRRQLGSDVYYQIDYEKFYNEYYEKCGDECEHSDPPPLSIDVAKEIANHSNVSYYDINMSGQMLSTSGFKPYYNENDASNFEWWIENLNNGNLWAHQQIIGGAGTIPKAFVDEEVRLVEGRHYTQEDVDASRNVVVISSAVAQLNGLSLGDTIELGFQIAVKDVNYMETSETVDVYEEFEIIGLFESNIPDENVYDPVYGYKENKIFMPYNSLNSLLEERYYIEQDIYSKIHKFTPRPYTPNFSIVYTIDDPKNIDKFKEEASKLLTSDYHRLYADDYQYKSLTKPINSVKLLARIATYAMVINGAIIVSLITALTLKERNYEIGVLLSLGVTKLKIISQFFFELLIVSIIAFALSLGSGSIISKQISNYLIDSGVIGGQDGDGEIDPMPMLRSDLKLINPDKNYGVNYGEILDETNFGLSLNVAINIGLSGLFIIFISTLVPSLLIMRFNPKKILTNK